ncbi:MAG TPA: PP2C family protein-serine/threonine phosphatase [Kineosporiaceae bacterium]|nr:PP2C family protein-serine/threonine phosphatase [Kineosporiaceae bacterium]
MAAGDQAVPPGRLRHRGVLPRWLRVRPVVRRAASSQPVLLLVLVGLALVYVVLSLWRPTWFTVPVTSLLLLVGGFFLRLRQLLLYYLVVAVAVGFAWGTGAGLPGGMVTVVVTGLLVLAYARSRERLGVQGSAGDSMLVDLRDRLKAQGVVPPLGPGWQCETVVRPAYGDSFSGDFLVAARSGDGLRLEIVLVDVSGKGQQAGTRALLLSGAFGGLLGALPREEFLPAANRYLLRQQWREGFATALYLGLDLQTGAYRLSAAGHPPAAHFHVGSGRWTLVEDCQGPLLGVLEAPVFPARTGVLERGDAMLLYTDGLVENRGRDIDLGIDRLVGQAERVIARGLHLGSVTRIVDGTRSSETDDRALILIWRS